MKLKLVGLDMTEIAQGPVSGPDRRKLTTLLEIAGSVLAMAYAFLIASSVGAELVGFSMLLVSSGMFAIWALIDRRWMFLSLQFFYACSAIIGLIRWG